MRRLLIPVSARYTLLCLALALPVLLPQPAASVQLPTHNMTASAATDPDKPSSEMNHHIAGAFLIVIGLSVIAGRGYRSLAWMRWLPAILFITAGLFLAAWSDSEIWPRGDLGWSWLVHHDAEARQHKFYALLLIAIGSLEAVQASPRLRQPWLIVVLPALCVIGGTALLFHQHSGEVVASTAAPSTPSASMHSDSSHGGRSGATSAEAAPVHQHGVNGLYDSSSGATPTAHADTFSTAQPHSHEHGATGPAAKIQREHGWFAVAGFCIAFFKLLYDAARPPAPVRRYLWASSVVLLGLLLLLYSE
ncbi:MAG TPA: hypothetical protein VJA94_23055 [Candidatus Angelobacter sp.]